MDTEPAQSPQHTPGREGSWRGATCRTCGQPFSNPHPSAKQRRAHKKKCAAHLARELKLGGAEEKESSQEIENAGLVDEIPGTGTDKALEPCNLLHANKIKGHNPEESTDWLDREKIRDLDMHNMARPPNDLGSNTTDIADTHTMSSGAIINFPSDSSNVRVSVEGIQKEASSNIEGLHMRLCDPHGEQANSGKQKSQMKPGITKDQGFMKTIGSVNSQSPATGEETACDVEDVMFNVACPELTPVIFHKNTDAISSSISLQRNNLHHEDDTRNETSTKGLNVHQKTGYDKGNTSSGSNGLKCEADLSIGKSEVVECLASDELEPLLYPANMEVPGRAIDLDTSAIQTIEDLTECNQMQSSIAELSHGDLVHQKFQNEHVENVSRPHSGETDRHEDFLKRSIEHAAINGSVHPAMQEVPTVDTEIQSSPAQQPHEELDLVENYEPRSCQLNAYKSTVIGHKASSVEEQSSVHIPKTGPTVDSYNQTHNAGQQWIPFSHGSISSTRQSTEGLPIEAPSAANKQSSHGVHASNSATEDASSRNCVQNTDLHATSSLMNLVKPCKQPNSDEFNLTQNPQQLSSSLQERKNETDTEVADSEMTTSITNGRTPKLHTLRSLLRSELEITEDAENAHDNNMPLPLKKVEASHDGLPLEPQSPKMDSENFTKASNADQKEQSTPSRLPERKDEKQQAKGKSSWSPFMCCKDSLRHAFQLAFW